MRAQLWAKRTVFEPAVKLRRLLKDVLDRQEASKFSTSRPGTRREMTHVGRDHGEAPRRGDRPDPEVRFIQPVAFPLKPRSHRPVHFGGRGIERQDSGRSPNELAHSLGRLGGPTLRRAVEELTERDRGRELLLRRQLSEPSDQVERRVPPQDS